MMPCLANSVPVMHASHRVKKAVIPAAGLGTRFLPATKATPKEMLPVVDKPAIQYVVEEAVAAGLADILMVTGRNKRSLEDHFDHNDELERTLESKGDVEKLARVQESADLGTIHYVRQGAPLGLGHAVLCAEDHVAGSPFAVLLGDDLIDPRDPLLSLMIDVRERRGGSVVALLEVPRNQIHLYGCAAVEPVDDIGSGSGHDASDHGASDHDVVRVTDLVEKPSAEEAPSNLAIIGRYVLDPAVFDAIRDTPADAKGEIQLTDALRRLSFSPEDQGGGVFGVVFRGRRYDTGDRGDYLKAVVRLASEREDLGPEFMAWLREFVEETADRDAAQRSDA
jgi:UTP--glucose-1-phosphate uridylyltransferase